MYISFDLIAQKMDLHSFMVLQAIKQKESFCEVWTDELKELQDHGYIERCKNGSYKLTSKGSSFLTSITEGNIPVEVKELAEELIAMYNARGKNVGRKMEIESRLAWFVDASMFSDNTIKDAVAGYLAVAGEYTSSLENLIWKPQSLMSVHKHLKDSKLFDIIASKYGVTSLKTEETTKSKEMRWLMAVSKLPDPPKNASPGSTFTGDALQDAEAIKRIKIQLYKKLRNK